MDDRIIEQLYDTFTLSTRQGQGGMTFKYVPNEDVINRMNKTFKGNWSTFVKFRDITDDQVILEVEVKVIDPDTQMSHSHTGFGSQQIMRYNSGPNAGKIIDIGNGYKGALAKAIVNACTRWGVGLFKESNPMADNTPVEMPMLPETAAPAAPVANPIPMPMTPEPATAVAPMPVMPTTTATAPPSPYTQETTAVVPPVVEMPPMTPPVVETTTTFAPPLAPDAVVSASIQVEQAPVVAPALPTVPPPAVDTIPNTPELPFSKDDSLGSIKISDVQKVALNGILTMNNAEYLPLAEEAFAANSISKPVPSREDLNYEEAVVVIKFGNEKYRKNR